MRTLSLLLLTLPALAQGSSTTSESGLEYSANPSRPAPKRRPVLVLLHGTGGNSAVFGGWASAARKRDVIVVLPQSTGTGDAKVERESEAGKALAPKKPALAALGADGEVLKKFETPADLKALAAAVRKGR